jgi:hypothetical protein
LQTAVIKIYKSAISKYEHRRREAKKSYEQRRQKGKWQLASERVANENVITMVKRFKSYQIDIEIVESVLASDLT